MLVPCIHCICVSNHIRMQRTGICLLPRQRSDDWVLESDAVAPPNLPFYLPTPPNISHLKYDVLEHHVNLGGDGATKCIIAMHRRQYISQVSFCVMFHRTYSLSQQKTPSHRTNTSRKCRCNACLFPSFIITASLSKMCAELFITFFMSFPFKYLPWYELSSTPTFFNNLIFLSQRYILFSSRY